MTVVSFQHVFSHHFNETRHWRLISQLVWDEPSALPHTTVLFKSFFLVWFTYNLWDSFPRHLISLLYWWNRLPKWLNFALRIPCFRMELKTPVSFLLVAYLSEKFQWLDPMAEPPHINISIGTKLLRFGFVVFVLFCLLLLFVCFLRWRDECAVSLILYWALVAVLYTLSTVLGPRNRFHKQCKRESVNNNLNYG